MEISKRRSTRGILFALVVSVAAIAADCSPTATSPTPVVATEPQHSALAPVIAVYMLPSISAMRVGETVAFSTTVELGVGVPPSFGPAPRWSSTNPAVIAINGSGNATAIARGESTIEVIALGHRVARDIQVLQVQP
jgi:uncharacterized protein YjdB